MPKIMVSSADVQLLESLKVWVADQVEDNTVVSNGNGHAPAVEPNDDPEQEKFSLADLNALNMKDFRNLANKLGCKSSDGKLLKKQFILDWMEVQGLLKDELADDDDDDDDDNVPVATTKKKSKAVESVVEEDDDDDDSDEEGNDDDVTEEDLRNKDVVDFPRLLKFAKDNKIDIPLELTSKATKNNRTKIVDILMEEMGEDDDDDDDEE